MSLLCDYFVAPNDASAAPTLDWVGGPSQPPDGATAFPTVPMPGIEPLVMMGTLDGILTGRSFDDVLADPSGHEVASADGGERIIWALPDSIQDALAESDDTRLRDTAARWVTTDEFWGQGDATEAGDGLIALREMLRVGRQSGQRLYCWCCV
jgi:hypothetical protein